jgi:hypothetical protein
MKLLAVLRPFLAALLATACGVAPEIAAPTLASPPAPAGPISQGEAIDIGLTGARSWGEPNAVVLSASKESRGSFEAQMNARGEYVNVAVSSVMWIVRMSGNFTPLHGPPGGAAIHCQTMFVVIVVDSGDIVSAGCE